MPREHPQVEQLEEGSLPVPAGRGEAAVPV